MKEEWQFPPESGWLSWTNKVLKWAFNLVLVRHVQVSTGKTVALSLSKVLPNLTRGLGIVWRKRL